MGKPRRPTPAQARAQFHRRIAEIFARYRKMLEAQKGGPELTTYWREGYEVKKHRVKGHWVTRSRGRKVRK